MADQMDSTAWDERYRSAERLWSVGPNVFVADRLSDAAPGRALDLGSGEGRNAIWLAEQGWQVTAVDFSPVAVARGREQSDLVDWVVADILTWESPSKFDLVLIAYIHLSPAQFETLVNTAVSLLADGGELFLVGHDMSNIESGVGGPQVPERLWDVDVLREWLADLELIEASVVERPVTTDAGTEYARDTLVRARYHRS